MSERQVVLRELKKQFKQGPKLSPFLFTQKAREGDVAMYHITKGDCDIGYEVFLIRRQRVNNFLHKEIYAQEKDFWVSAFSYATLELAKWGYEKMKKEKENERRF